MKNKLNKRLEFYVYYNDSNGINIIFDKCIQHELLNTHEQFTITSTTNTEWKITWLLQ